MIIHEKRSIKIGRQLGRGGQASVHALVDKNGTERCDWVVKLAPLPQQWAAPKKKKSVAELNANSLYSENLLYQNSFRSLQGVSIPKIPLYSDALEAYQRECNGT